MDTFFVTKKAGKSSRNYTYMQLFVTDKGFVFVVPMKSKSEVPQALKLFAKQVGAPDAIICDYAGEQTSKAVRHFCQQMGTTLRVLEEHTPLGKPCRAIYRPHQGIYTEGYETIQLSPSFLVLLC